jgi:iron complex transport system substrate-binding protein
VNPWRLHLGLLACLLYLQAASAGDTLTDDLGNSVAVRLPAQRIVSLAPHITELLYAAGAGGRIVAAVEYSDYPPAARNLPRIGDAARIDRERLLLLEPDLVIAWGSGTPARELDGVRRLGMPLYLSEPRRLEDIGEQLRMFGHLAGTKAVAAQAAAEYERRLDTLRKRYADTPRRPVFYQLARQPLLTVNAAHIIHDVVNLCGGVNPFADLPELTPRVDIEAVLAARPTAVIFALYPGEDAAETARFWRHYGLDARTRFIAVPGDYIHRATPRILEGAERICAGLAGE